MKYNLPRVEAKCIKSVIDHTEIPYDLIVYDNWESRKNLGQLWNELIRQTSSQYICLLNSDTEVESGWLKKLVDVFWKEKKVGAVGPSTNSCHGPQSNFFNSDELKEAKYELVDVADKSNNQFQLVGFCFVFPRVVWVEVGGFPEDFGFYAQESAFLLKIKRAGYKTLWRKDVFIKHLGGVSIKKAEEYGIIDEKKERVIGNQNYKRALNEVANN